MSLEGGDKPTHSQQSSTGQTPKANVRRIGVLLFLLYHPRLLLLPLEYFSEACASFLLSLGVYPREKGKAQVFTTK
jgi:hypothetical protein